jgi:Escherichia/Staphylococcus phage prohead protease
MPTRGGTLMIERHDCHLAEFKLADAGQKLGIFSGYGAVFGNVDAVGDVIEKGAFTDTLKEWKARGKFPPMLLQHGGMFSGNPDALLPVGRWTQMEENAKGLKVTGELFALSTERGQYIYEGLKSGELDGLSIGFRTRRFKSGTKAGEPDRTLLDIDLREVSIVTFPANDRARITGVKTLTPAEARELESLLGERGVSREHAVRAIAAFKQWLQREAEAPGSALREEVVPDVAESADDAAMAADRLMASIVGGLLKY